MPWLVTIALCIHQSIKDDNLSSTYRADACPYMYFGGMFSSERERETGGEGRGEGREGQRENVYKP